MARSDVFAGATVVAVAGVLLPLALVTLPAREALQIQSGLRNLWSILFICAGALHLVHWRLTGLARSGLVGSGALVFGLLSGPMTAVGPLLYASATTAAMSPVSRTLAVVVAVTLLTRAAIGPAVDSSLRPGRIVVVAVGGSWLFVTGLIVAAQHHDAMDAGAARWFAVELALTSAWLLSALAAARRARRTSDTSVAWVAMVAAGMGLAELMRALALGYDASYQLAGSGVQLGISTLMLVVASRELSGVLAADNSLRHLLTGTVRDAEDRMSRDEQCDAVRRHDARSVLASLRAASLVLDRYDETLDQDQRALLLRSFSTELARLEQFVEQRSDRPLQTFRIDHVVAAVAGPMSVATVSPNLAALRVNGRVPELVSVLRNVLTTLARGDTAIDVHVARGTAGVQVVCVASPPSGSDPDAASADSLRLQMARRVLRDQAGDVVVSRRSDGSVTVALWLRPADTVPPEQDVRVADFVDSTPSEPARDVGRSRARAAIRKPAVG